jgi:hypothetical protein
MSKGSRAATLKRMLPLLLIGVLGLLVVLTACHPGSIDNLEETDIVLTHYDRTAQFGALRTYVLDKDVTELRDPDSTEDPYDGRFDAAILNTIKTNMNGLGYVEIDSNSVDQGDENTWPDMLLRTAIASSTNLVLYSWYPWYPGWGWGWGWGPGWPATGSFTYRSGTVRVDMFDVTRLEQVNPDSVLVPVAWDGLLNGIAEGTVQQSESRIINSINQMFTQSPYLGYQGN